MIRRPSKADRYLRDLLPLEHIISDLLARPERPEGAPAFPGVPWEPPCGREFAFLLPGERMVRYRFFDTFSQAREYVAEHRPLAIFLGGIYGDTSSAQPSGCPAAPAVARELVFDLEPSAELLADPEWIADGCDCARTMHEDGRSCEHCYLEMLEAGRWISRYICEHVRSPEGERQTEVYMCWSGRRSVHVYGTGVAAEAMPNEARRDVLVKPMLEAMEAEFGMLRRKMVDANVSTTMEHLLRLPLTPREGGNMGCILPEGAFPAWGSLPRVADVMEHGLAVLGVRPK